MPAGGGVPRSLQVETEQSCGDEDGASLLGCQKVLTNVGRQEEHAVAAERGEVGTYWWPW